MSEFTDWLRAQLNDKGWTQNELGRRADLSSSTISNLITEARLPGEKTCTSLSIALGVPLATVRAKAGLGNELQIESIDHLFSRLSPDNQRLIRELITKLL